MGHSVVRTESRQNHFHSSEISPKHGTTLYHQRQFTSHKIHELIHVRQRIVLKMGHKRAFPLQPGARLPVHGGDHSVLSRAVCATASRKTLLHPHERIASDLSPLRLRFSVEPQANFRFMAYSF